jgi:hypothetical protein
MKDSRSPRSLDLRGVAMIATAIGAVGVGAFAIGRLVIRRLSVENAKFKPLDINDLTVTRLHAAEVTVSHSLDLPGGDTDRRISRRDSRA